MRATIESTTEKPFLQITFTFFHRSPVISIDFLYCSAVYMRLLELDGFFSSSYYVYIDVCLWAWTAWANVKSFSDYKSSNLKYVPFAHARFYLRVFIFCTSTLFIVNSIVFSNFIMKYDIEVKTRRKKLFNENNCNDFFCSFQTYSNKHRKNNNSCSDRSTNRRESLLENR